MGEKEYIKDKLYTNILRDIERRERKRIASPMRWAVAAAILVAMLSSVLFFYLDHRNDRAVAANATRLQIKNDIAPGGNKATLTLADGSKITLDDAADGALVQQPGICITKAADGQLVYSIDEASLVKESIGPLAYNFIEIPKGGQYQVILPDGSKVWLNAGSSLRYPTRFAGKERKVELAGEAYFEVAKSKDMPFRVMSNKQVVEVLGTHFNINAYADEAAVKTTLLEGSVNVSMQGNSQPALLEPGQQAMASYTDNTISVQAVDVEEAVAWKNGYFIFMDEDLPGIMRKLARWYNIEVIYQGDVHNLKFGGVVSRSKSITQTLRILELTGSVQFKVEGRRVTVMP